MNGMFYGGRSVSMVAKKVAAAIEKKCFLRFDVFVVCGGRKSCSFHRKKNVSGDLMFLLLKSDCVALY
jgi:hypothetical protein